MNAGYEAVLAAQGYLLDNALGALAEERPGQTDLYFVGFAPYGRQDVFKKDVEAAQQVMDSALAHRGPLDRAAQQSADAGHRRPSPRSPTCARR